MLIAACAHLSVPLFFTPVPVTLQPFAVLLLALLLSPRLAFGATIAYLAEGAIGLPVFTPYGLGGIAQLLGPTGGYLLSYPVVALLVSVLWRSGTRTFYRAFAIAAGGSLVTLAFGAAWLGILTHETPLTLINTAVLPFLPADALKVAAAAAIGTKASRLLSQRK
jgi:biotin transport system substrate-specific component